MYDQCAIGTMAWGSHVYARVIQGNAVDEKTLIETLETAEKTGMLLIDTAHKYGLGYAEKLIGMYGSTEFYISTKFTPGNKKRPGALTKAFEQDLADLHREYVDIYWLHLPIQIHQNLMEIIRLVKQGKIKHVGVSNFNFEEIRQASNLLAKHQIPLYGVQNHYSLLSRDWEKNGVLEWCHQNHVKFYAWSILEQGALTGKMHYKRLSLRGMIYNGKLKKLQPLFHTMESIAKIHQISLAQVNIAWALSKNIIPICGCRKPYQVEELAKASEVKLDGGEVKRLEEAAEASGVHISGDVFRKLIKFA